ncbi:hypothetical protein D3C87_16890 [compost metagenome]
MKNKRFTYVLIAVVGFIYFKLFVRISSNIGDDSSIPAPLTDKLQVENIKPKKDFHLRANYPDPFLKNSGMSTTPQSPNLNVLNENIPKPPPPKKEKPIVYWPAIKYFGIVQKTSSKKPRALISVDGIMYKIYPNEELFDGLTVKSIKRESIVIAFQKEVKTIALN